MQTWGIWPALWFVLVAMALGAPFLSDPARPSCRFGGFGAPGVGPEVRESRCKYPLVRASGRLFFKAL